MNVKTLNRKLKYKIYLNRFLRLITSVLTSQVFISFAILTTIFLFLFGFYFNQVSFPNTHEKFGVFGDFIGGLLNPILASFTLLVVIWSSNKQMEFIKVEVESNKISGLMTDLKLSAENLRNELNKSDEKLLPHIHVRKELIYLAELCERKVSTSDAGVTFEHISEIANAISESAGMLAIYIIVLEQVLLKTGPSVNRNSDIQISQDYRMSIVASCFDSHREMLGLMYLLTVKFKLEFSDEFGRVINLLNLLMSVADFYAIDLFDEFCDSFRQYKQRPAI